MTQLHSFLQKIVHAAIFATFFFSQVNTGATQTSNELAFQSRCKETLQINHIQATNENEASWASGDLEL